MNRRPSPIIIDGQMGQIQPDSLLTQTWRQLIKSILADNGHIICLINRYNHQRRWLGNHPNLTYQVASLAPWGPPTAASLIHNHHWTNNWLIEQKLTRATFLLANPANLGFTPAWSTNNLKVCLWPLLNADGDQPILADPLPIANLMVASHKGAGQWLKQIGYDNNQVGHLNIGPSDDLAPGASRQIADLGDTQEPYLLWPIDAPRLYRSDQELLKGWRLIRATANNKIRLVIWAKLHQDAKDKIRRLTGAKTYFVEPETASQKRWLYKNAGATLLSNSPGPRLIGHARASLISKTAIITDRQSLSGAYIPQSIVSGQSHDSPRQIAAIITNQIDRAEIAPPPTAVREFINQTNWPEIGRQLRRLLLKCPGQAPAREPFAYIGQTGNPDIDIGQGSGGCLADTRPSFFHVRPGFRQPTAVGQLNQSIPRHIVARVPGDQLQRYAGRIYHLKNDPDAYQILIRSLTIPGIVIADDLYFDRVWPELVRRGLISRRRYRIERLIEKQIHLRDQIHGAYSVVVRSQGLILKSAIASRAANNIRPHSKRIRLVDNHLGYRAAINDLSQSLKPADQQIFIDISGLAHNWLLNLYLTGIQRYEHQLLLASPKWARTQFIYWQESQQDFVVVGHKLLQELTDFISDYMADNVKNPGQRQMRLQFELDRLKQPLINHPGDRILIPQGLWDNKAYIQKIIRLSQQSHLHHLIYDLIPIVRPEYVIKPQQRLFKEYINQILANRPHLITISRFSAKDIRHHCQKLELGPPKSLKFIELGDNPVAKAKTLPPPQRHLPRKPFLLVVGTIEIRKNHQLLIDVNHLARDRGQQLPQTIVAGKIGWLCDQFLKQVQDQKFLKDQIKLWTDTDDWELNWLYKNCSMTIFGSLYEGWGLPVCESLAWHCPTIVARTSSLPEAGGSWADYFDPNDPAQLLKLINHYLDKDNNQRKRDLLKRRYQPRTWQTTMAQTNQWIRRDLA